MGSLTLWVQRHFRAKDNNKILGLGRLHSTLDRAFGVTLTPHRVHLDHPLQWCVVSSWRRCHNNYFITHRPQIHICRVSPFRTGIRQMHERYSRIRSRHPRASQTTSPRVITCIVKTDFKIVTGQIEKDCSAKELVLIQYLSGVRSLENQFKGFTLHHIEWNKNEEADMLAKATTKGDPLPSDVFFHTIGTLVVRNLEGLQITQDPDGRRIIHLIMTEDWHAPITLYRQGHCHPSYQS
jgi:hypothetical protein